MLAQDVADARALAHTHDPESGRRKGLVFVEYDELRVVLDARAGVDRANEIVGLFSRGPGPAGTEPELFVEPPYGPDHRRAQEDRERDRPVPQVLARQLGGISRPRRRRTSGCVGCAPADPAEAAVGGEAAGDALEQVVRIRTVVVREGDEIGMHACQPGVARVGEAAGRTDVLEIERGMSAQDLIEPAILVLVDDHDPKPAMRLALERLEQPFRLLDAIDRGHHEIEGRKLGECHGRTLAPVPLVSVLLAVHNDARYVHAAVESALRQTVADLELIVVDDASTDETTAILSSISDPRLSVLTNEEQLGLAASLNRGLDQAHGRYVARIDADDVAFPDRVERQLARIRSAPPVAVLGAAVLDLDETNRPGTLHRNPLGARGVRWLALFGSPFFHPTVLVDRELLDRRGLRYDPAYLESEDYDLWTRLLGIAEGANLGDPLVLKRVHAGQASLRRSDLQESFQRQVALREIARIAPELGREEAELAWELGGGRRSGGEAAPDAYLALLEAFERRHGIDAEVRRSAARTLLRARSSRAFTLGASYPARLALGWGRRRVHERAARRRASSWLEGLAAPAAPTRVTVVSPEPTPYRSPLLDLVAARPEVDLTVIYAARTVAGRTWSVEPHHTSRFLRGVAVPGLERVFHHDYPVTPGIFGALRHARPDVVVVSGWSTFASQAAIAWCRARGVPYLLLVESHDIGPRSSWRRVVKGTVVPRVVRNAAGALVLGTASRNSLVARGAPPARVRVFANTIDVPAWEERVQRLAGRRNGLRADFGAQEEDVIVLSVARLGPEKGIDMLVRAVGETGDPRLLLVLAGEGPERAAVDRLARELDVRLHLTGDLPPDRIADAYAAADVFALLSSRETWGVVVNEAAASGLPLVLSDRVGAAYDLLRDGENGFLVPAGDVTATAVALARLAADPALRHQAGERSRGLVRDWGYEPSVESFVAAVREATAR